VEEQNGGTRQGQVSHIHHIEGTYRPHRGCWLHVSSYFDARQASKDLHCSEQRTSMASSSSAGPFSAAEPWNLPPLGTLTMITIFAFATTDQGATMGYRGWLRLLLTVHCIMDGSDIDGNLNDSEVLHTRG